MMLAREVYAVALNSSLCPWVLWADPLAFLAKRVLDIVDAERTRGTGW